MITLEDVNTWLELFNFDIPLELDLSENVDSELYTWNSSDVLTPKFNYEDAYFTVDDDVSPVFNNDGTITLTGYDRDNPFYLFPTLTQPSSITGKLCYFNPLTNINRLVFADDDLADRKCYINYLDNTPLEINDNAPLQDDYGWFVPLDIVFAEEIACDEEGSKTFIPKVTEIYEPPMITVGRSLYIGNTNQFSDVISCSVDYTVYYQNKPVTELYIPVDTDKTSLRVKVVTKSEYPYIPTEKWLTIPIEYKSYTGVSDLSNYTYLKLDTNVSSQTWNITHDVTLISENNTLSSVTITNNGKLTFENVGLTSCSIRNNNSLTVLNADTTGLYVVNDGKLTIKDSDLNTPTLINNNNITLTSNNITTEDKTKDLPIIHSSSNDYSIIGNTITFDDEYTNTSLMFIRTINPDKDLLLRDNSFTYDATLTVDNTDYNVEGNGLVYGLIDDDTLYFYNLEVNEDV